MSALRRRVRLNEAHDALHLLEERRPELVADLTNIHSLLHEAGADRLLASEVVQSLADRGHVAADGTEPCPLCGSVGHSEECEIGEAMQIYPRRRNGGAK